uniref:YkvA family protein n=1 Tax=uncultured Draconibacterium sp. TaxID=1573823 RepID=UPI0032171A80
MDGKYSKYFSEKSLWEKIKKYSKEAGEKVVYAVLLLFYTMQDKSVGTKAKIGIAAALGYFIFPTDAIFDVTPLIGYSDDLGVLLFALSQISANITPEVKNKARGKLSDWFGTIDSEQLDDIDNNTF